MLQFLAKAFDSMNNSEHKKIHVAIDLPKASALEPTNSFARAIAASKPTMAWYKSKWNIKDAIKFQ